MKIKEYLDGLEDGKTLLGICPMTEEIVQAAIVEAKGSSFIPTFIATPRQVDADRGYTGWSQKTLNEFISSTAHRLGYQGDYFIARDHGGPYQSFRDRGKESVSTTRAMEYARELFYEDVEAGFDVIHVDATEDPGVDGQLPLENIASRTAQLISSIEERISKKDLSWVQYEVGTEEIIGGMTKPVSFKKFIKILKEKLSDPKVFRKILFVVGQVGTTMSIDMQNNFDPDQARKLVQITDDNDAFLKVHYTDWLDNSILADFPEIGIGAANVGPEFAAALIEGLVSLEEKEKRALKRHGAEARLSEFFETFKTVAVKEAPWEKFAPDSLDGEELKRFARKNRENIAYCVGRYVLNKPQVRQARETLNENVREFSIVEDAEMFLVERVRATIHRYVEAFNLDNPV